MSFGCFNLSITKFYEDKFFFIIFLLCGFVPLGVQTGTGLLFIGFVCLFFKFVSML